MRYLITTTDGNKPFFTEWFEPENHFNEEAGMVVYDLVKQIFTKDGINWELIEEDYL